MRAALPALGECSKRCDESIDLVRRGVVQESDAHCAARLLNTKRLGGRQGVEVSTPNGNCLLCESLRDLIRMVTSDRKRECGDSLGKTIAIRQSVQMNVFHVGDAVKEAQREAILVYADGGKRAVQSIGASSALAQRCDVVDGCNHSGLCFVRLGTRLEAMARWFLVGWTHAIGGPRGREIVSDRGDAQVWPEPLVRRRQQHVCANRHAIDSAMRREVRRVGPRQCANSVRRVHDPLRWRHRAQAIRCEWEGHDPCLGRK